MKIEINIESYLNDYAENNKDYNVNDLASNQRHLARLLQYIYVCNPAEYQDKSKLYDKYTELFGYVNCLIVRDIPKYRRKDIGEDILNKFTMIKSNIKFNPKTFGEIEYVDKLLDMPENEKLKLKAVQIAKFWEDYEKKDEEINNLKKEVEILKKQLNSKKRQKLG